MAEYQFRLEKCEVRSVRNKEGWYEHTVSYTPIGKMSKKFGSLRECRAAARKYMISKNINSGTGYTTKVGVIYLNGQKSTSSDLECYGDKVYINGGRVVVSESGSTYALRTYGGMYH